MQASFTPRSQQSSEYYIIVCELYLTMYVIRWFKTE